MTSPALPEGGIQGRPSLLPIPDPTELTVKLIKDTVEDVKAWAVASHASERHSTDSKLEAVKGDVRVLIQRITDIDKATELLSNTVNKVPSETDLKVGSAVALFNKDISAVNAIRDKDNEAVYRLFDEREKRAQSDASAAAIAVAAALKAAQEAVSEQNKANSTAIAKSEVATQKTIDKNADLAVATTNALSQQIVDLKDSVADARSNFALGLSDLRTTLSADISSLRTQIGNIASSRSGGSATLTQVVAIISAIVAVVAIVYAIAKP